MLFFYFSTDGKFDGLELLDEPFLATVTAMKTAEIVFCFRFAAFQA